ncbi:MAG: hypothetical protein HQL95_11030 [Magnetococcales bacterium]|nr:hypothetical protein [Magnetococcales bacterium]
MKNNQLFFQSYQTKPDHLSATTGGMRRMVGLTHHLLIALLAWELAEWSWRGLSGEWPSSAGLRSSVVARESMSGPGKREPESWRGLFGGPQGRPEPTVQEVTEAPVTRLEVRLVGLLSARDNSVVTRAVIVGREIPEGSFGVGESVGPAVIRGIEWDRVVLEHQGRLETLRLPRSGSGSGEPEDARTRVSDATQTLIGTLWSQFEARPETILDHIRVEPVFENGQFRGVQLFPGANPKFLEQFDIHAGDIVTWMNGVELTDPMKGMEILGRLGSADVVQFRVQRGSETHAFEFHRK